MNPLVPPDFSDWSQRHAVLMILGILGVWLSHSLELLVALSAGSFTALLLRFRGHWNPQGRFGLANTITTLRLLGGYGLIGSTGLAGGWSIALSLLLLFGDGIDGWAARRFGTGSPFGHGFDQEVDAFVLVCLCLLLLGSGRLGSWILIPGALRYVFVCAIWLFPPPLRTITGNRYTRSLGTLAMLGLTSCLLPLRPELRTALAAAVLLSLLGSFAWSAWALYRPSPPPPPCA